LTNILDPINKTSKKLQYVDIDLITVVELYKLLIHYVESLRNEDSFKILEDITITKSGIKDYDLTSFGTACCPILLPILPFYNSFLHIISGTSTF